MNSDNNEQSEKTSVISTNNNGNDLFENKEHTGKNSIYLWLIIVLLFCISFTALVFSLSDIDCQFLKYSNESFKDLLCVLVSSFAIVITAFLVIMDISASNRNREIERKAQKVDGLLKDAVKEMTLLKGITDHAQQLDTNVSLTTENLNSLLNNSNKVISDFGFQILSSYEDAIALAEVLDDEKKRNNIKLMRARMAYNYPMLDTKMRKTLICELSAIGERDDIMYLEKIYNDPNENNDIKFLVGQALDMLKKKYP